jgi:hypothetical protein
LPTISSFASLVRVTCSSFYNDSAIQARREEAHANGRDCGLAEG